MLYPTLRQPLILLWMLIGGFVGGIIFDIFRCLTLLSGNDKYSRHIFDFLATASNFVLLFLINLHTNFGQFRFYVLLVFMFSFWAERIISKILWTKLLKKWYINITQRRNSGREEKESS